MSENLARELFAPKPGAPMDRRVARTRAALRAAFNGLFFERGYDGFGVGDIADQADVGRSTFYQHYADKAALLAETVAPLLAPLADAGRHETIDPKLAWVVEHFWENRRRAQAMIGGGAWAAMTRLLATMIEARLNEGRRPRRNQPALPTPLAASLLARAQMGLIEEWVCGHKRCSAEVLARALHVTTRAAEAALVAGA
jgi:AcrR family transcriptional regulator